MMKKKIIYTMLLIFCSVLFYGCGKSEKEKVQKEYSNYYQDELGMDKEEADDLSEIVAEIYEDDNIDYDDLSPEYDDESIDEAEAFVLYELLPEMKGTKSTDDMVQVCDIIIKTDFSMSLKDLEEILQDSEALKYFKIYENDDELSGTGICDKSNFEVNISRPHETDSDKDLLCSISVYNPGEYDEEKRTFDMANKQDYLIYDVSFHGMDKPWHTKDFCLNAYNCYFSESINVGVNSGFCQRRDDFEMYKEMVGLEPITYNTAEEILAANGYGPLNFYDMKFEDFYSPDEIDNYKKDGANGLISYVDGVYLAIDENTSYCRFLLIGKTKLYNNHS